MKEKDNKSKGKFLDIAKSIGTVAKTTADALGTTTKNAAISLAATVKENNEQLNAKMEQRKNENDIRKYRPVYEENIKSPEFVLPSMIRVVGDDVRRTIKACEGAIGYYTEGKGAKVFNIYKEHLNLFDIEFYPYQEEAVYYVDPCYENHYIRIDEYFVYLKKVRVDELISLAQDLGAKHVEIVLKAKALSSSVGDGSGKMRLGKWGVDASFSRSQNEAIGAEIAADINFSGQSKPVKPKINYFKNESDILSLIEMRMTPKTENRILSKKYSFRYGNSSGIKVSDAEKIDLSLASLGLGLSRSVTNEVNNECDTLLEYSIEF